MVSQFCYCSLTDARADGGIGPRYAGPPEYPDSGDRGGAGGPASWGPRLLLFLVPISTHFEESEPQAAQARRPGEARPFVASRFASRRPAAAPPRIRRGEKEHNIKKPCESWSDLHEFVPDC